MANGRDKTALGRAHKLYIKYRPDEVEKTAASIAKQKQKERELRRRYKNKYYKEIIAKLYAQGKTVNAIYIALKPLILKDLKFDPKAMIEMVTGKKITVVTKKDNEHNNR